MFLGDKFVKAEEKIAEKSILLGRADLETEIIF
jgi:hypothetical protein